MKIDPELISAISAVATFVSTVISLIALFVVYRQLKVAAKQQNFDSLLKIADINRALILAGFDHPEMFDVLKGNRKVDPDIEHRYIQLWVNQIDVIWKAKKLNLLTNEHKKAMRNDIYDFMSLPAAREFWKKAGDYYPEDFRNFMNTIIEEINEKERLEIEEIRKKYPQNKEMKPMIQNVNRRR